MSAGDPMISSLHIWVHFVSQQGPEQGVIYLIQDVRATFVPFQTRHVSSIVRGRQQQRHRPLHFLW